ncbi:MAG: aminotransferase class I/II-fold pyridoxal phosphate-dependent enzyme [Dongiaceae bacterium]
MNDVIELSEQQLRRKNNAKWTMHGQTVLPASVAEMDFALAPAIKAAIERIATIEDYGYAMRQGEPAESLLGQAFAQRMQARFGWQVDAERVVPVTNLVQAIFAAVSVFSQPGDAVALQLPAFPPLHMAVNDTGRRLIPIRLQPQNGRYVHDLDDLKAQVDARTRVLLICNPQNPTGCVFDRDELLRLTAFAVERDMVIVSDEIHADLIFDNRHHIPVGTLGAEIAARTVTLNAASKSFNIAGLRCGVMHFGSIELQSRFQAAFPKQLLGAPGVVGIMATIAAWEEGQPWLDAAVRKLQTTRDHLVARLQAELPAARFIPPEATYLAWIDFSGLDLRESAFRHFLERGVALGAGEMFDAPCSAFGRLNFATSLSLLDRIIDCMVGKTGRVPASER